MATLDSFKPPYREIADRIRGRISTGHYPDGKIPSERALIKHYGVSRATATKALAALESEGLIVRRRGAGAFLKPQKLADERSLICNGCGNAYVAMTTGIHMHQLVSRFGA